MDKTVMKEIDRLKLIGTVSDDGRRTDPDLYAKAFGDALLFPTTEWSGTAFRRDAVLMKIDLAALGSEVTGVTASSTDFRTADGAVIPADQVEFRFVTPTFAHDSRRYIADCMDRRGPVLFNPYTNHTLITKVTVPADAKAGNYTATVTVSADGVEPLTFAMCLEVLPYTLPEVKDQSYQLELWTYPYSCERYYSGKTTKEYFGEDAIHNLPYIHLTGEADDALRSQLELYRKAGGRAITVTCVEDSWNSQTPDPYPSMIKWHCKNGVFSFDYTDFDKWVTMNMECGIDRQIKTFSVFGWGYRIVYINDDTGEVMIESPTPGSERWTEMWSAFIRDYMKHTLEKGWFDITYLSMDERAAEEIRQLLDLKDSIKTPDGRTFKTSIAVYRFNEDGLYDRVDDLSMLLSASRKDVIELADHRRELGLMTTGYTCGAACSALENDPYENEFQMLLTEALHLDGFLRWALDAFNADPIASSAHYKFAAGDIYLIYPDHRGEGMEAHSSHRFEKIAEGIRDVEKIRLIRRERPELVERIDEMLGAFGKHWVDKSETDDFMKNFYELVRS